MKAPEGTPATQHPLAGNGALLVRERAMASAVQGALERLYQLERVADVHPFVEAADGGDGAADGAHRDPSREALLVREHADGTLEMALRLPRLGRAEFDLARDADLDPLCQIIEGVSHFVYLAERARSARTATQLELELQAEVDKYVVLASATAAGGALDVTKSRTLRRRLYEDVAFSHDPSSELGARYRVANARAHAFVRYLEQTCIKEGRFDALRAALRRFQRGGQEEKLRLASTA